MRFDQLRPDNRLRPKPDLQAFEQMAQFHFADVPGIFLQGGLLIGQSLEERRGEADGGEALIAVDGFEHAAEKVEQIAYVSGRAGEEDGF